MDKNKIAALLEALCERPFAGESQGRPHDQPDTAGPTAQPRMRVAGEPMAAASPAPAAAAPAPAVSGGAPGAAELAAILSGTAADAHAQAFQAAATQSAAVRLDAQSALAFVDGLDQAPLAAPPGLVEQVLAAPPDLRRVAARRPGIWTRLFGAPRRQAVAALALLLMAAGVSWPLLRQDGALPPVGVTAPPPSMPKVLPANAPFGSTISAQPGPPAAAPILAAPAPTPPPTALPGGSAAILQGAPPAAFGPRSVEAPARAPLALADPCAPREAAKPAAAAQTASRGEAAKRAPSAARTAAVEPTCPPDQARGLIGAAPAGPAAEAAGNVAQPPADQGTVRASRASRAADVEHHQPTTIAPLALPPPRPASPTLAPNAFAPAR